MAETDASRGGGSNCMLLCQKWFGAWLERRFPGANVSTLLLRSGKRLGTSLRQLGYIPIWPTCPTWNFHVDLAGIIISAEFGKLVLARFVPQKIGIEHIGEMGGYCRICRAGIGLIISPKGPIEAVSELLEKQGRRDILVYGKSRVELLKWDNERSLALPCFEPHPT